MGGDGNPGRRGRGELIVAARREALAPGDIEVLPATPKRWPDVVTLLGGATERGCWCQSWRGSAAARGFSGPAANRDALEAQILEAEVSDDGFAPGLIAYVGGQPVGWCGLGPRAAMPRLVNSRTIPAPDDLPVWSIGCFVVRVGYRRIGVAKALLAGAIEYARDQGAPAVEAYPIDPGEARVSTSFGFVGFTSMFEAAGFERVLLTDAHSAGLPRWLMRLELA